MKPDQVEAISRLKQDQGHPRSSRGSGVSGQFENPPSEYSEDFVGKLLEQVLSAAGLEDELLCGELVRAVGKALNAACSKRLSKGKARAAIELAMQANGITKDKRPGKLAHALYAEIVAVERKQLRPAGPSSRGARSPYRRDIKDFRTYRYQPIPLPRPAVARDAIAQLLDVMPNDALPFSNHRRFDDFFAKLDIVFKTFFRNFYAPDSSAPPGAERTGATRFGVPKKFEASRISSLIEHGRNFAALWDRRFAGILGRASAFFPIAESDVFVRGIEEYVTQIRNTLLLAASETRPEELALLESSRILRNVNHLRLLGPHDRFQDSLVVVAAMNHLLILATTIRDERDGTEGLWNKSMPAQQGYRGDIRLSFGQLLTMTIIRGMDPDIYDTDTLTPRALIAEPAYRSDALLKLGRDMWPEGPISALMQMFEDLPDEINDDLDRLLVEAYSTPHSDWDADDWFQSPYTSLTLASAAQMFLNLLSVPFSQSLPLAELAFFPMFKASVVESLAVGATSFSDSLINAMHPQLSAIEEQTYFGMPADYPRAGIIHGPVQRRLTGPSFTHMPATYRAALVELARRKSFNRLAALLDDIRNDC